MPDSKPIIDHLSSYLQEKFGQSKVIIVGLGVEGMSSYNFIRDLVPQTPIMLMDSKNLDELGPEWTELAEHDSRAEFRLLTDDLQINDFQPDKTGLIIFKTPGIPTENKFIQSLLEKGAELNSNTNLCFELIDQLPQKPITIGVTGTKGKSTTASLIHHVLKTNNLNSLLIGNIGTPALNAFSELFSKKTEDIAQSHLVFELSSHQLRELRFSPHIAVIQDITPEHLDYYNNFASYQKAKSSITTHQNEDDIVVFNPELRGGAEIAVGSRAQQKTFTVNPIAPQDFTAHSNKSTIFFQNEAIMDIASIPLIGKHNLLNVLPAVIVGKILGLSSEQVAEAVQSFQPLMHRLEFVAEKNGVQYINDSQATTPEAAKAALASFPGKKIHLIAGGSEKGVDLKPFVDSILANQVKTLALFPPTGEKIAQLLSETTQNQTETSISVIHVTSMQEAVNATSQAAEAGDVVLLSPACASFGIFRNYQDRGDQFKKAVLS